MGDLVFGLVVYKEGPRQLRACLGRLRQAYSSAPVFCISDGFDQPGYCQVCRQFNVDYLPGERLKLLCHGARWWDRFLRQALFYPAGVIVKIDPDTFIHRPFRSVPPFDLFGTLTKQGEPGEHVQGGCQGIRRSAAERILASGLCNDPVYCSPHTCPPKPGKIYSATVMSTDFTMMHIARRLGLSHGEWPEVDSRFIGEIGAKPWKRDAAATHPHKVRRYDVECDWNMLSACNYRCGYCRFAAEQLSAPVPEVATPERWSQAFDATGKLWLIHMSGGEPFLYPGFVKLAERLARRHILSISTNLDSEHVAEFIERVPARRVAYLHVGAHLHERRRRGGEARFKQRLRQLAAARFLVYVSVTMTPDMCREFPPLQEEYGGERITLVPKVLVGGYGGRVFPQQYSDGERQAIHAGWAKASSWFDWTMVRLGERPTISFLVDQRLLAGTTPQLAGRLCASGRDFVAMDAEGDAWRCGSGQCLGNLLAGTLRLNPEPRPCDASYSQYYCAKYLLPESRRNGRQTNRASGRRT